MSTPMSDAVKKVTDTDERERILRVAQEHKIPANDPIWEIVGDTTEIREIARSLPQQLEKFKEESDQLVANLRQRLDRSEAEKAALKQMPQTAQSPSRVNGLMIISSFLGGTIVAGLLCFFWIIPSEVSNGRSKEQGILGYLGSEDGKKWLEVIKLNQGYFPGKCKEEAQKQGVFLTLKKTVKRTDVCVLLVP